MKPGEGSEEVRQKRKGKEVYIEWVNEHITYVSNWDRLCRL